ncbi:AraC family ligand binding domain-containing protein [Escherichia coli]
MPGEIHHYGRHPEAREWYHQWVLVPRAPTGINGLTGRQYLPIRGSSPDEAHQPHFSDLFGRISSARTGRALFGAAGDKSVGATVTAAHGSD